MTLSFKFKIALLIFISLGFGHSYALELSERLNFKLAGILTQNIVVIDRGSEDHVRQDDHIKITVDGRFVARALCLKTKGQHSFWKIYRSIETHLFIVGNQFQLEAINLKDVAPNILAEKYKDWESVYSMFDELIWQQKKNQLK